ncbi:MAG: PfkB family carbohydrate kinase, partial [Oscillospiraceae bacterium]
MKILNIGSLNIDRVYSVKDFVKPSETIKAIDYKSFCGGKGLNQSIAVARAGASIFHGGVLGADGGILLDELISNGVDASFLKRSENPSGHAVIEVNQNGE